MVFLWLTHVTLTLTSFMVRRFDSLIDDRQSLDWMLLRDTSAALNARLNTIDVCIVAD